MGPGAAIPALYERLTGQRSTACCMRSLSLDIWCHYIFGRLVSSLIMLGAAMSLDSRLWVKSGLKRKPEWGAAIPPTTQWLRVRRSIRAHGSLYAHDYHYQRWKNPSCLRLLDYEA